MRFLIITLGLFLLCAAAVAQKKSDRKYEYGTLSGTATFTGYFWFDNNLTQMGQRILFKKTLDEKKTKTLYATTFTTFKSDSVFRRTFETIPYGFGRLAAMLPRIVAGPIELYDAIYAGTYEFETSDHFYLYVGREHIRLVRRKFKTQVTELIRDDADIVQRIERGELTYDDMPSIIHNYNMRKEKH